MGLLSPEFHQFLQRCWLMLLAAGCCRLHSWQQAKVNWKSLPMGGPRSANYVLAVAAAAAVAAEMSAPTTARSPTYLPFHIGKYCHERNLSQAAASKPSCTCRCGRQLLPVFEVTTVFAS